MHQDQGEEGQMGLKLEDVTPGRSSPGLPATARSPSSQRPGSALTRFASPIGLATADSTSAFFYRDHEPWLALAKDSADYEFQADVTTFKLAAEALRIRMADLSTPCWPCTRPTWHRSDVSTEDQTTVTSLDGTMFTGNGRTARYSSSPMRWTVCS
jgi:hypothetical protein